MLALVLVFFITDISVIGISVNLLIGACLVANAKDTVYGKTFEEENFCGYKTKPPFTGKLCVLPAVP